MKILSNKKRIEIEEFLTKGYRNDDSKYIILKLKVNGKEKRMKRSRAYFQYFNRVELTIHEIVHHIDENKKNDDVKNLEVCSTEEHISNHHAGSKKPRKNG